MNAWVLLTAAAQTTTLLGAGTGVGVVVGEAWSGDEVDSVSAWAGAGVASAVEVMAAEWTALLVDGRDSGRLEGARVVVDVARMLAEVDVPGHSLGMAAAAEEHGGVTVWRAFLSPGEEFASEVDGSPEGERAGWSDSASESESSRESLEGEAGWESG